ncbi:MAG: tRNA pseudouridine(55) synthase TruB [Propionibacteriaceae bacterium]|jgi:tRNA pseudouridine55 synthase|nr:tRNA pseudouridine(55) synthase TruB [Propionibacteriaceae bacterium]
MTTTIPDGILILDKPAGLTSQTAVTKAKRALGVRKAGHAGTLDPAATGVLIVGFGRATRLLGYLSGCGKEYLATIRLGQATSTDDAEGEPLGAPVDAAGLDDGQIAAALEPFRGEIEQVPSAVSAIKVAGVRAYKLAREGVDVELKARRVTVSGFHVLARRVDRPYTDLDVLVECSSGTYIRALARDLGKSLGVGGHLTALRRTRVGPFTLPADPTGHLGLDPESPNEVRLPPAISLTDAARQCFPYVDVDAATADDVRHGRRIKAALPADPTAVCCGEFLALYHPDGTAAAVFV